MRAIECSSFPFEHLSLIAETESWRKEIHRPIYHLHKWWAQRLGSVFRAILIGAATPAGTDVLDLFYAATTLPDVTVFDPFMGSGTTVGEALKLGMRAIGRDINPVAYLATKAAFTRHDLPELERAFAEISEDIRPVVQRYYHARLEDGSRADVLYYFWVKQVQCLHCGHITDLFDTYLFATHAYPARHPESMAVCPLCGAVLRTRHDVRLVRCDGCGYEFDPSAGPAKKASVSCTNCRRTFRIIDAVRGRDAPPAHRLYAKVIMLPNGDKRYVPADEYDRHLYDEAAAELSTRSGLFPVVPIMPGYNTDQAIGYSYHYWHQMFNSRQLLVLGLLGQRIRAISNESVRELFVVLFSGMLEFNNMFASFKGEGTGAVRPIYSHHVLKPEKMPLEANPWFAPSGSFTALFRQRLLRALAYAKDPFEVRREGTRTVKVRGLSQPMVARPASDFEAFRTGARLYLSCGDSSTTDLADESVDLIVTDPPFFDNVHYSELADFFFVWQVHLLGNHAGRPGTFTTRSRHEVQAADPDEFRRKLTRVWLECARVLRRSGLLAFTFHQSDPAGWRALLHSLIEAGFVVTAVHPVRGELSRAVPKSQAREPILYDVLVVCRKRGWRDGEPPRGTEAIANAVTGSTRSQVDRLLAVGLSVGAGDVKSLACANAVRYLSWAPSAEAALEQMGQVLCALESMPGGLAGSAFASAWVGLLWRLSAGADGTSVVG